MGSKCDHSHRGTEFVVVLNSVRAVCVYAVQREEELVGSGVGWRGGSEFERELDNYD